MAESKSDLFLVLKKKHWLGLLTRTRIWLGLGVDSVIRWTRCITNLAHGWWVSIQSTGTLVEFQEAIQITLHPDNINRDSGSEIPEAWMPTIRQHNSRSLPKRTAERSVSSSDNTWPTMPWIETHQPLARFVIQQSLTTTVVQIVWLSKSTISPDEDLKSAVETSRSIWKWQLWD